MPPSPRCVCSPFDDADADIIFRSSDEVDFRLYRVILAKASPVFGTMLELPQPSSSTPSAPDEPHVVKLTEDAKTLESLLRLCYPVEHPNITSVDDVHPILEAARKYDMECVTANLQCVITRFLSKEPLHVYVIAYMLQIEDVAKEAANLLLDVPQFHIPPSPPPEFSVIPSLAIYAVHVYRQKCTGAALRVFEDQDWVYHGSHERAFRYTNGPNSTPDIKQSWVWVTYNCGQSSKRTQIGTRYFFILDWYDVYLDALKAALTERPSGRTVRLFPTSTGAREALSQAASCSSCAPKACVDLMRFSELLADKIDDAIARVKIELPFSTGSKRRIA